MNQIRLATPADAEAIRAIYAPYVVQTTFTFEYEIPTREEFLRRMESFSDYPWLVYEQEGRVVGYAYASPFNERAAYDWTADLSLYLDTHPDDKEAFQVYRELLELAKEGRKRYEERCGVVCKSDLIRSDRYTWLHDPWPWDAGRKVED